MLGCIDYFVKNFILGYFICINIREYFYICIFGNLCLKNNTCFYFISNKYTNRFCKSLTETHKLCKIVHQIMYFLFQDNKIFLVRSFDEIYFFYHKIILREYYILSIITHKKSLQDLIQ